MNITKEWLKEQNACNEGMEWFNNQTESDCIAVLKKLLSEDHWNWFVWLAPRAMTHEQKVQWAIRCAELVLPLFEAEYPLEQRPRAAILAAREWLKNPTPKTKADTCAAADAADAAYAAAYAADAAYAARSAAYAAARAAAGATYATYDATYAADAAYAARGACAATCASARKQMQQRCADIAIEIISIKGS